MVVAQKPRKVSLCETLSKMLINPGLNAMLARRVTGFGDPFPKLDEHQDELIGTRVTHLHIQGSASKLHDAMSIDSFILISLLSDIESGIREAVDSWKSRSKFFGIQDQVCAFGEQWKGITALLIRPDAIVAWIWRDRSIDDTMAVSIASILHAVCIEL